MHKLIISAYEAFIQIYNIGKIDNIIIYREGLNQS